MTTTPQPATRNKASEIIDEIRNLKRKTAMMQYCHGRLASSYIQSERILTVSMTLFSGLAIVATTAEARSLFLFVDEELLRRGASALTIIVFILTLYRFEAQPGNKAEQHTAALNSYTRFLRHLDSLLPSLDKKPIAELEQLCESLAKEYSDISDGTPNIPSRLFLKFKQNHLQTISVSRALDKTPFKSIKQIKKELSNQPAPPP